MACKQHAGNEIFALATLVSAQGGESGYSCPECALELGELRAADQFASRVEALREQVKRLGGIPEA